MVTIFFVHLATRLAHFGKEVRETWQEAQRLRRILPGPMVCPAASRNSSKYMRMMNVSRVSGERPSAAGGPLSFAAAASWRAGVGFHQGRSAWHQTEGWSRDVSEDLAEAQRQRCADQARDLPASLEQFVERYQGRHDVQTNSHRRPWSIGYPQGLTRQGWASPNWGH